jgi:hypothetical protein
MEEPRRTERMPARLAPAAVTRQFHGCRIERQLLTQVFDLIWQGRNGVPLGMRRDQKNARKEPLFDAPSNPPQAQGGPS